MPDGFEAGSPPILERRLDLFEAIPAEAKAALLAITSDRVAVQKNEQIREAGGPAPEFWIVTEGWFYSSGSLSDGGRQVYAFYLPGDVMGLQDLGWQVAVCDVTAATKAEFVRIGKDDFARVIAAHPVLSGFFLTYGIYDHTQLIDRLRAVGRMEAVKRVAHLLCQLFAVQEEPGGTQPRSGYALPIDQSVIGDAVGLTNISVSRMLSELERRDLIAKNGRRVKVPDMKALKEFAEFQDRRRAVPLSWVLDASRRSGGGRSGHRFAVESRDP